MILTAAFLISKALGVTWSWWWIAATVVLDANTDIITIKSDNK